VELLVAARSLYDRIAAMKLGDAARLHELQEMLDEVLVKKCALEKMGANLPENLSSPSTRPRQVQQKPDKGCQVSRSAFGALLGEDESAWDNAPDIQRAKPLQIDDKTEVLVDCLGVLLQLEVPSNDIGFQLHVYEADVYEDVEASQLVGKLQKERTLTPTPELQWRNAKDGEHAKNIQRIGLHAACAMVAVNRDAPCRPTESHFLGSTLDTGQIMVTLDPLRSPQSKGVWFIHVAAQGRGALRMHIFAEFTRTLSVISAEVDGKMDEAESGLEARLQLEQEAERFNDSLVKAAEENERKEIEEYNRKIEEQKRILRLERQLKKRGQEQLAQMIKDRRSRQTHKSEELAEEKGGMVSILHHAVKKAKGGKNRSEEEDSPSVDGGSELASAGQLLVDLSKMRQDALDTLDQSLIAATGLDRKASCLTDAGLATAIALSMNEDHECYRKQHDETDHTLLQGPSLKHEILEAD